MTVCGSTDFQCISGICRDVHVACGSDGSGSAAGEGSNAADCFASFHIGPIGSCYNAIREGFLMLGSGSAVEPRVSRPMVERALRHRAEIRVADKAAFRRPGGIH